ncbi:MAG: flagellar hook-associated protein FlgK [Massilia sp.]|nr:flagellar hook-associated protein FlgK [Massilia sp.]
MAGSLLDIGKTGLFAAQASLATAGNNIANANVAGYSRQVVMQTTAPTQNFGYGFVGTGTQVTTITRYSDSFLNDQVRSAQASTSALGTYYTQVSQIDNMLSDSTTGLSPALQGFFNGLQAVSSNPTSTASRQALLSSANTLAASFQTINSQLNDIRDGVNSQITSNVTVINSYAQQIAQLNNQIAAFGANPNQQPNDLLDARDKLVADLNKQVKATVVQGDNNSVTVSIGSGQPLVVGNQAYQLAVTTSPTDVTRLEVGYVIGNKITPIADGSLTGGELGGLLDFRANTLDQAQNSLGRIALTLAATFNAQHQLGQDAAGNPGGDFFTQAPALVTANVNNSPANTAVLSATVSDPTKLTNSDYKVAFDGTNYTVTRLSDNQKTTIAPFPQTVPQTIDGVDFNIAGSAAAGDSFLVRPTINGAAQLNVAISDVSKIAVAAPITTSAPLTNTGSGKIGQGSVDNNYLLAGNKLTAPVTLTYASAGNTLSGFPAGQSVTVTNNGVPTVYPAGTTNIPFTAGANYSFGGVNLSFSGQPADTDSFSVGPNVNGVGDNRNAQLLGKLQSTPILDGGSTTFQSSYAQLVSIIGNKTREVQVNGQANQALLDQATGAQQSVSGVNLDEEAANLLRYQQAYQASGKVMQIASTLFDTLLTLGN